MQDRGLGSSYLRRLTKPYKLQLRYSKRVLRGGNKTSYSNSGKQSVNAGASIGKFGHPDQLLRVSMWTGSWS